VLIMNFSAKGERSHKVPQR